VRVSRRVTRGIWVNLYSGVWMSSRNLEVLVELQMRAAEATAADQCMLWRTDRTDAAAKILSARACKVWSDFCHCRFVAHMLQQASIAPVKSSRSIAAAACSTTKQRKR
jgi:hypothetical protein